MKEYRLYDDLAWTWPIISPPEHYEEEDEEFRKLILEHTLIEVKTMLDLGCGGGHNDYWLKRHFDICGVDRSPEMLNLARTLNPEITYLEGDMRTVRLGRVFDTVCIFDAISYMLTPQDLRAAFRTAWEHLKPGGVFLTYVEQTPETFKQNRTQIITGAKDGVEITFVENNYDPDFRDTTHEATFIYLIRLGGKLEVEVDRHLFGIFPLDAWIAALAGVGFQVKVLEAKVKDPEQHSVPTLVGVKPLV